MDPSEIVSLAQPLSSDDAQAVHRLARAAAHVDGVDPLSEQPLLHLEDAQASVVHLLVRAADDLAGYAQVDLSAPDQATAELVVHPFARQHGVGTALLGAARAVAEDGGRRFSAWAHGDLPAARSLAASAGLVVVRELWRMELDLTGGTAVVGDAAHAGAGLPDGVTLRTFQPGADDAAWLALNARAFASHPEQGRLTQHDLDARVAEPWFDAESFLLAVRGDELLGSIWLKVPADQPCPPPVGEIYAVGVDPAAQGLRLGSALTRAGVARLADLGVRTVELYTEGDNAVAIRTYTGAGFTRAAVDVQHGAPA